MENQITKFSRTSLLSNALAALEHVKLSKYSHYKVWRSELWTKWVQFNSALPPQIESKSLVSYDSPISTQSPSLANRKWPIYYIMDISSSPSSQNPTKRKMHWGECKIHYNGAVKPRHVHMKCTERNIWNHLLWRSSLKIKFFKDNLNPLSWTR